MDDILYENLISENPVNFSEVWDFTGIEQMSIRRIKDFAFMVKALRVINER